MTLSHRLKIIKASFDSICKRKAKEQISYGIEWKNGIVYVLLYSLRIDIILLPDG